MPDVQSTSVAGETASAAPSTSTQSVPAQTTSQAPVSTGAAPAGTGTVQVQTPKQSVREKMEAIREGIQSKQTATSTPPAEPIKADPQTNLPPGATPVEGQTAPVDAEKIAAAVAEFKSNFKYTFKGEEKEIPEMFRTLIKDAETEKQVKELFEKSTYFEEVKPQFAKTAQELTAITQGLGKLDNYIARDPRTGQISNMGKFLDTFSLTDNDIFKYAQERLQYHNLPDDQRQQIDAATAHQEQIASLQAENASHREQRVNLEAQVKGNQVRELMKHPEVAPVIVNYPGKEQGFYRDVAQNAFVHFQLTGRDLSPTEAVGLFMQQRGLSAGGQNATVPAQNAGQAPAPNAIGAQVVTAAQQAPTLPKIPGQGTSPAKKMVKSLNDLKKIRSEMQAQS